MYEQKEVRLRSYKAKKEYISGPIVYCSTTGEIHEVKRTYPWAYCTRRLDKRTKQKRTYLRAYCTRLHYRRNLHIKTSVSRRCAKTSCVKYKYHMICYMSFFFFVSMPIFLLSSKATGCKSSYALIPLENMF